MVALDGAPDHGVPCCMHVLHRSTPWTLVLLIVGCGSGASPSQEPAAEPAATGETVTASTSSTDALGSEDELPADMHVVVFFDFQGQRHHLDVRVLSDATGTTVAGVRADETRAHPVPRRFTLDASERASFARLVTGLGQMPRCEPLAAFPNEPHWQVESERYNDRGPSLWFRENGPIMLNSTDPCLAYVRLAHFVFAAWDTHVGV